jgi:polar amino acid transport system permease protein
VEVEYSTSTFFLGTQMTTEISPVNPFEEDLKRILDEEHKKQVDYRIKLLVSWIGLMAVLALLFSGIELDLGFTQIKFISLNTDFIKDYAPFIAKGAVQTILISITSIAFAMALAMLSALARLSNNAPLVALSTFYVSLIRGTPLYLQVIFFFLALPQMGIYMSGFYAGVAALGLNYGAYMSEIFRAGILSVSKGQHEAATALGMNTRQKMTYIILPQALRLAIPPIGNEYIAMLKDSALVSVTGFVHEILWRAQKVGRQKFKNLEALLIAAVFYWILTLLFTALQTRLENRLRQGEGEIKPLSH